MDPANNQNQDSPQSDPPIFGGPTTSANPTPPTPAPTPEVKTEPTNYTPFTDQQPAAAAQPQVVVANADTAPAAPLPPSGGGGSKRKIVAGIIGLFLVVGGIGAGLMLVNQNQDIRQEAAADCDISVPSSITVEVGQTARLSVADIGGEKMESMHYINNPRLTVPANLYTLVCPSGGTIGNLDPQNEFKWKCRNPEEPKQGGFYVDIVGNNPGTWNMEVTGKCDDGRLEVGPKTVAITVTGPVTANSCETCAGIAGTACADGFLCVIPGLKDATNKNAADLLGTCLPTEVAQNREVEVDQTYIDNYCSGGGISSSSPSSSPSASPSSSPSQSPSPSPSSSPLQSTAPTDNTASIFAAHCQDIKVFDESWNQILAADLSDLSAGDTIRLTASATATSGTFTKARFTVNGVLQSEVTTKRPSTDDYYDEYTIPSGITSFSIEAQVYHDSGLWI